MECPRCGYNTHRKDYFFNHLNRKFKCQAILADVSLDDLKKQYGCDEESDLKCFKCNCGKSYTHLASLSRHRKTCNDAKKQITNNTTNIHNITNNITNNVNIYVMPFGEENKSYLTSEFLTKCLKRTSQGLFELLQHIHFHPDHAENHNLRITNKKDNYIQKHDGNMWQYENKQKILDELFKKGFEILDDHYYDNETDLKQKLSRSIMTNINNFIESVNNKEKDVVKPLLDGIYLLILNKSYMVLGKK